MYTQSGALAVGDRPIQTLRLLTQAANNGAWGPKLFFVYTNGSVAFSAVSDSESQVSYFQSIFIQGNTFKWEVP
jgi:hypothetical protein